jgi:aspartate/glutamate racemase
LELFPSATPSFLERSKNASADRLVLCANTPHTIATNCQSVKHPLDMYISEATAEEIAKTAAKETGLLERGLESSIT